MTFTPDTDLSLSVYADLKRSMCAQDGGPHDLILMVELHTDEGVTIIGLEDRNLLRQGLRLATETVDLRGVVVLAEAWVRVLPEDQPPPERGDLQRDFLAGDVTVGEILTAVAVDASGEVVGDMLMQRVTYDDEGQPRFDEVQRLGQGMFEGALLDDVRAGVTGA